MAGAVLRRADWSIVLAQFTLLPGAQPEAVEHHTAGAGPGADLISWLRALEAGEMARGDGLIALAYHWMVISGGPHDGTKIEVRPWDVQGGATLHHNTTSRAVCMSGDFTTAVPTEAAMDSTAEVWADGMRGGYVQHVPVRPHSDFYATACCGTNLKARLADLNDRIVRKLAGPPPNPKGPFMFDPPIALAHPDGGAWIARSDGVVYFVNTAQQIVKGGMTAPADQAAFAGRTVKELKPRKYGSKYGYTIIATSGEKYVPSTQH